MVETDHPQLSIRRQCEMLEVNRNRLEVKPRQAWEPSAREREIMDLIQIIHRKDPSFGARQLCRVIPRNGYEVTRWKVGQMMRYTGPQGDLLPATHQHPRRRSPQVSLSAARA